MGTIKKRSIITLVWYLGLYFLWEYKGNYKLLIHLSNLSLFHSNHWQTIKNFFLLNSKTSFQYLLLPLESLVWVDRSISSATSLKNGIPIPNRPFVAPPLVSLPSISLEKRKRDKDHQSCENAWIICTANIEKNSKFVLKNIDCWHNLWYNKFSFYIIKEGH